MDENDKALRFPASGGWTFHVEKLPNYADAMANRAKEIERLKTTHEAAGAQRKDWGAAMKRELGKAREIKPLPPRDPNKERDRDR